MEHIVVEYNGDGTWKITGIDRAGQFAVQEVAAEWGKTSLTRVGHAELGEIERTARRKAAAYESTRP